MKGRPTSSRLGIQGNRIPLDEARETIAGFVLQAIHNSHDGTYQFPEDVESQAERVAELALAALASPAGSETREEAK